MSAELASILSRLRKRSQPGLETVPYRERSLLKEAKKIQAQVEVFFQDQELAKKMHNDAIEFMDKPDKHHFEQNRDTLISSMFFLNRENLGNNLNKELELEQIMSVLESLKGNKHIQLGTGQGKSSVVIPIASIVHSLSSPEKDALVVSINQNLVNELADKVDSLILSANKLGFKTPVFTEKKPQKQEFNHGHLQKSILAESLLGNENIDYSENLKESLFNNYWGENLAITNWEAQHKGIEKKHDRKIPRIVFMTKDQFVFAVTEGKEAFVKTCPDVFFDEIDAPYIIGETYQTTSEDLYMTPQMMIDFTSRYIFDYIISKQLNPDEDFEVFRGETATLTESGQNKINQLNLERFLSGEKIPQLEKAFQEGIDIVARFLDMSGEKNITIEENIRNYMKAYFTEDIDAYAQSVGDYLAQAHYWLNKVYLTEGENIVVRSEYFDQLLENHKFDPFIHLAILAQTEKFNFVNLTPKASQSAKFPTILTLMGNKLHGFSGTLSQRSLLTGKLENSSLGNFLKDITGKEIFEIPPREVKKPPSPTIVADKSDMKNQLIKTIRNHDNSQPLLLISHYDVGTTNALVKELKTIFPEIEVESAPPLPSKPEKLADYYTKVKKSCSELAEGKIKILITSGSLGIGANIVGSDGSFPNLKVGILGLPENHSQLRQNLGRRRAKGDNFFWIVDKEALRERTAWLDTQAGTLIKAHLTPNKALEEIDKLSNQKENKNLEFVLKLIHDAATAKSTNEEFTVLYDSFFRKKIVPTAKSFMQKRILEKYFDENIDWKNKKDEKIAQALKRLERLLDIYGLPDSLYSDCLGITATFGITTQNPAEYLDKLNERLINRNILEDIINNWFDTVDNTAAQIETQFYGDDRFSIFQIQFGIPIQGSIFIPYDKSVVINYPDRKTEAELGIVRKGGMIIGPGIRNKMGRILTIGGNIDKKQYSNITSLIIFKAETSPIVFAKINRE